MSARGIILFVLHTTFCAILAAAPPTPETAPATGLENNQVTLRGAVRLEGRPALAGFQIREAGQKRFRRARPQWLRVQADPEVTVHGFEAIAIVKEDTDYEYRAVAIVRGIHRYGQIQSFHSSAFPPEILHTAATRIDDTAFVLSATINPRGRPAYAKFDWGTNSLNRLETPAQLVGGGTNPIVFQVVLLGLETNQLYFFGIKTWNEFDSSVHGGSFLTAPPLPPPGDGVGGSILWRLPPATTPIRPHPFLIQIPGLTAAAHCSRAAAGNPAEVAGFNRGVL